MNKESEKGGGAKEIAQDDSKVNDSSSINKVTAQCIASFSSIMFGTSNPDPTRCKLALGGTNGPVIANWDEKTGFDELRDVCNNMPEYGDIFFMQSGTLPDGYATVVDALPLPQVKDNPAYMKAKQNEIEKDNALTVEVDKAEDAFAEYVEKCKGDGTSPKYLTWKSYLQAEDPYEWGKYQAAVEEVREAAADVARIVKAIENSPWRQSVEAFGHWMTDTKDGTTGKDSYWTATTDYVNIIKRWKKGQQNGAGACSFNTESPGYKQSVASGHDYVIFDSVSIGAYGGDKNVFDSSSIYKLEFSWSGSATIPVIPPGSARYNFAYVRLNRNGPLAAGSKASLPLTGANKAAIPGVITAMILIYGLKVKATFDKATAKRLQEESKANAVNFGFFAMGAGQKVVNVEWDKDETTVIAGPLEQPAIVGYTVDPLNNE